MGDERRFSALASYIARNYPKTVSIADVAGGKGYLNLALKEKGFQDVITFDTRSNRCHGITYRHQWFEQNTKKFDLLVGMHPDEATDVIIAEAAKGGSDFIIVPCCIKPTAYVFWGQHTFVDWCHHLEVKAEREGFTLSRTQLSIKGKNILIHGRWK